MEFKLNNGFSIPALGLGTYKMAPQVTEKAILSALKLGYRHIDTATYYGNEKEIGNAIRKSGIPREELFITTKMWNDEHDNPKKAFDNNLKRLGIDYVDLYLIHWPVPERDKSWKVLEQMNKEGRAHSIGVSNFMVKHLDSFLPNCEIKPAINQFQLHPFNYPKDIVERCKKENIQITAYSPLCRGIHFNHPLIQTMAKAHSKTPAQIQLRWAHQQGAVVIPKSENEQRQKENMDFFDFQLTNVEMVQLNNLGIQESVAPDPNQFD